MKVPDTRAMKIGPGQWVNLDGDATVFKTRREVRDSRRGFQLRRSPKLQKQTNVTMVALTKPEPFSSLQRKLYHRLTSRQGVEFDNALEILRTCGYNKAASYGHMREAGANHYEAKIVIDLNNPQLSRRYGLNRQIGITHTEALAEALK